MLNAPLDLIAENAGSVRLAEMRGLIGPYLGVSGLARKAWLAENRAIAKAVLCAFHVSVVWLSESADRDEAIALLRERMQETSPELAQKIYARLTDADRGIKHDTRLDIEGLRKVLRLRSIYGAGGRTLDDPFRYVDSSLLPEALARR